MDEGVTTGAWVSIAAALGLGLTALYVAIARRHSRTWKSGVVILLASAELIVTHTLQVTAPDEGSSVFWYKLYLLGLEIAPTAFLWLALAYRGLDLRPARRAHLALTSAAGVIGLSILFNDWNGWFWNPATLGPVVPASSAMTPGEPRPGFWLVITYAFSTMGLGCFILSQRLFRSREIYGWQAGGVIAGALVAWAMAALDIFGASPLPPFAATLLGLSVCVTTVALSLSRLRRRDLISLTRGAMISSISDTILVVDGENRIVDMNPAAEALVGKALSQAAGTLLAQSFPELNANRVCASGEDGEAVLANGELVLHRGRQPLTFDLRFSPIRDGDGRVAGNVIVLRDISERKQMENALRESEIRLRYDALHDALTGLANRTYFMDRLARALNCSRRGLVANGGELAGAAVLFMDLDHFKIVNDSLGHSRGDELLIAVARRLEACLRSVDTLARFGGDEFAILMEDIGEVQVAVAVAERIQQVLQQPFRLDGHDLAVSASIGIALASACPEKGPHHPEDVLRDADTAMYAAKARGKARWLVFEPSLSARPVTLPPIEADLEQALPRQEFQLCYQSIRSLATGQVTAMEPCLYWKHPQFGRLAPAEFISLVEKKGQSAAIGEWLLQTACAQVTTWHAAGRPDVHLAVDLFPGQLQDQTLPQSIHQILRRTELSPRVLEIRITEEAVRRDLARSHQVVDALDAMGIQVIIGDFGTGFTALSYLRRFHAKALKIDHALIREIPRDADSAALTRAIIALAHSLELQVVAEGIETSEQYEFLLQVQCDQGQGSLFGRPEPPESMADLCHVPWTHYMPSPA